MELYYEEIGEGMSVIILHGAMLEHSMMQACMEPVFNRINGYKRFYIDLPGMGNTPAREEIDSSDQVLELLEHFIDCHIPEGSFLVAGQSYGGYLARGLLRKYESRMAGMILLCPVIEPEKERRHVPMHEVLECSFQEKPQADGKIYNLYSGMFVCQNDTTWKRFKEEILYGIEKTDNDFMKRLQGENYCFSFPLPDTERTFSLPVLIMTGKQDACVGYEDAVKVLKSYTRSTFLIVDGAGHNLQIEKETLFHDVVLHFLRNIL